MMNFRKSVTKFRKVTSSFHGLSWQQRKHYTSNIDKKRFEKPSDAYVSTVKFSFNRSYCSGVRGGGHSTPFLGSRCGSKNLGQAWVKAFNIYVTRFELSAVLEQVDTF